MMTKILCAFFMMIMTMCNQSDIYRQKTTKALLKESNPAICYGGYRMNTRDVQPTIAQIKEDLRLLEAINIKWLRSYNVHFKETENLLKAIRELRKEDDSFEMYLMLGAWIDCKNAWTELEPIHHNESERNALEIREAVRLANEYSDIVKIISVGNEAMVKWAAKYYVTPEIILKWVTYLQDLKQKSQLSKDVWITSSDDFASWGGGDTSYYNETLTALYKAVDYVSIHTYPMHNTHYNPYFWGISSDLSNLSKKEQVDKLMDKALEFAKGQYDSVRNYMRSIGVDKPIHIGETGWASFSKDLYGNKGTMATDEYKSGIYYRKILEWSKKENITIFYFEAFDESWKDTDNPNGSENNFGLFTIDGQAKFALWNDVDRGLFKDLGRDGNSIKKTYRGDFKQLMQDVNIKYRQDAEQ